MNDTRLHRTNQFETAEAMQHMFAALAPLLVGIRRQSAPPLRFGAQRFHRMHVLVMPPHRRFEVPSPSDDLERVLPPLDCRPAEAQARPVLGEILCGEQGEWYERIGNRIRPLRQLASGPNGEVFEVPNPSPANPADDDAEAEDSSRDEPAAAPARETACTAFRRLLAGPGAWRVLPFGAFKPLLAPQLTHAARLRDSHRLPCHVDVFEALAPQRIDALARAILGEAARPTDLQPLTPAFVDQLELGPLLAAPPRVAPFSPEHGAVRPGQRFFRIRVASDPTASTAPAAPTQTEPAPTSAAPAAPARATSIPVSLLRPWEFCRSREEAIHALSRADTRWARFTRPVRRWFDRGSFRRWQLLLSGRSADEQLWCISPPRGWIGDAWLRDWARQTLELGGYDSAGMLSEWEIFWGRKTPL